MKREIYYLRRLDNCLSLKDLPVKADFQYTNSTQTIKINPDEIPQDKTRILQIGLLKRRTFLVHYENGTFAFKELKRREDRLKELASYLTAGIITQEAYDNKVQEILKEI